MKGEGTASLPSPDQPSVGARRGAGGEGGLNNGHRNRVSNALTLTLSQGERGLDTNPQSAFPLPPSPFRLLLDPPASGAWNMAVDEALLEAAAADGQCTLRFYRWEEPTLSLGYFQAYADRWQHEASSRSAVVRRASGGGAILHDIELTYSFAVPSRHPLAVGRLGFYRAVHTALIEALGQWGVEATMCDGGETKGERRKGEGGLSTTNCKLPDSTSAFRLPPSSFPLPFLCFQRRSPGDVLVGETKIAGSAQRRCRGAVLQHGSVLLARSPAAPELDGLKELIGRAIAPEQLVEAWLARLAGTLPSTWQSGHLSDADHRRAALLATEKYASCVWTENRCRGCCGRVL